MAEELKWRDVELKASLLDESLSKYHQYISDYIDNYGINEDKQAAIAERERLNTVIEKLSSNDKFKESLIEDLTAKGLTTYFLADSTKITNNNADIILSKEIDYIYKFSEKFPLSENKEKNKYLSELEVLFVKESDKTPNGCIRLIDEEGTHFVVKANEKDFIKFNVSKEDILAEINNVVKEGLGANDPIKENTGMSIYLMMEKFNSSENWRKLGTNLKETQIGHAFKGPEQLKTSLMENTENTNKKDFIKIEGHIGKEPKVIEHEGKQFAAFTVAENKDGNTKWHNVQLSQDRIEDKEALKSKEGIKAYLENFKTGDHVKLNGYEKQGTYVSKKEETKGQTLPKTDYVVTFVNGHLKKEDLQKSTENVVSIKGRLGADPELKTSQDGKSKYYSFPVATGETGEGANKKPIWQQCKVYDSKIESSGVANLKKGESVEVKGVLGNEYPKKDKEGQLTGEVTRDLLVAETSVLKHGQEKNQEQSQSQSQGPGIS